MEALIIQDVFDPYYVGRRAFAARRVRTVSLVQATMEAEPGRESPLVPADTFQAELNSPPALPKEH
jgi:hypothetical protein